MYKKKATKYKNKARKSAKKQGNVYSQQRFAGSTVDPKLSSGGLNAEGIIAVGNSLAISLHAEQHLNGDFPIKTMRDTRMDYEKKLLRLTDANTKLRAENQALIETVKEYEAQHKIWSQEKINLSSREHRALQQLESCRQTKSFRLGYAIIFGFKSWRGFKELWRTLFTLMREGSGKKPKTPFSPNDFALMKPALKTISWQSQKPVLQWTCSENTLYLADSDILIWDKALPENAEIPVSKTGLFQKIDCAGAIQLLIRTNVYNKNNPQKIKQALLAFLFFDQNGDRIEPTVDYPFSKGLDKYYFYLNANPDFSDGIALILPPNTLQVEMGLVAWDVDGEIYTENHIRTALLNDGISIVIPTFKGEGTIMKCLESLSKQSLDKSAFEILVAINGEQDSTPALIERFKLKNPQVNIRVFELEQPGVSNARNYAIQQASRGWITFIDDDDFVAPDFLEMLYLKAMHNNLVLTGIEDIKDGISVKSAIQDQLDKAEQKDEIQYADVTSTLTMNACKLAPSFMVKAIAYNPALKSGEDVVYWSELLSRFKPRIALSENYATANYKRLVRDNSISRKAESYDFNVLQRIDVIANLIAMQQQSDPYIANFIQSKINAQASFIKCYLARHPQDRQAFIDEIAARKIHNPFVGEINGAFTETLVISYCYSPYIDTSGVVMSKRIRAMGNPVDIIFNNMDKVRQTDQRLTDISYVYLGKQRQLNAPQAFSNWNAIEKFADLTLAEVGQLLRTRKVYKSVYSRAMWPASHFAAAVVKMKYPQMKWTAEFSDPLLMDVSGKPRFEELPIAWLEQHGFVNGDESYINSNLFYWCEILPYLFADELIFTNKNQLEYMLSYTDNQWHEQILQKAVILPQPTLDKAFYELSDVQIDLDKAYVHLAYFGSFYVNRGFAPFVAAWAELPDEQWAMLRLHIYTQQNADDILKDIPPHLHELIEIKPYVGYFDFLKLTNQFDGLVVMDAETKGLKLNNPYLPSKLSDYLGSDTQILALVEEGSPMDMINAEHLSKVNLNSKIDIQTALKTFLM